MLLKKNDRARIVAGVYKGRRGVYKQRVGTVSAVVKLYGDGVGTRTIRRTSIEKDNRTGSVVLLEEATVMMEKLDDLKTAAYNEMEELEKALAAAKRKLNKK